MYSPSLRGVFRAVRLPPTPCRVCFRPCVFNKFSDSLLAKQLSCNSPKKHVVAATPRHRGVVGDEGGGAAAGASRRKPLRRAAAVAPQGAHKGRGLATCDMA